MGWTGRANGPDYENHPHDPMALMINFQFLEILLDAWVETEISRFDPVSSRGAFRDRHGR